MIRDYQALQYTWFEKGKQRIIKTTGKHRGVKLLATVDYVTGEIVWQEEEQYTAEEFLSFLKKVTKAYPTGNIMTILDKARIHHAILLQPFLKEMESRLKSDVINNVFYHTTAEIRKKAHAFMENLNPINFIDCLCVRMESNVILKIV